MAPLIDVVFLLLIFFVATTIFPENQGLIVERPEASTVEPLSDKPLHLILDKTGNLYFQGQPISADRLPSLVGEHLSHKPDGAILIEVDRRAATEALIRTMDICRKAGARQIAIMADLPTTRR